MSDLDFTKEFEQRRVLKAYGGANGSKVAIELNGSLYMLKFPSLAKNTKLISYSNSCVSEYVSCHILATLGIDVQETQIGTVRKNGKEYICVACKDFEIEDWVLYEFALVKNTCVETSQNGYGIELSEVLAAIEEQVFVAPKEVRRFFWRLFVADALLGNFDRHNGNWGFLVNRRTQEAKIAPVFDCGSCLYPQLTDEGMEKILADRNEIEQRIYVFPNSALKVDGKKINYFDFLMQTEDALILQCILDVVDRIDLRAIFAVIDSTPFISEVRKRFYKTMLSERYDKILLPAAGRAKTFPEFAISCSYQSEIKENKT